MESSSRVSPRKLEALLLTKSQAFEAPLPVAGPLPAGILEQSGQLAPPKRVTGKSSILSSEENTALMGGHRAADQ